MKKTKVYKFLPRKWGIKAIKDREIKVSRIKQLNDPFEFAAISLKERKDRKYIRSINEELDHNHPLICFSKKWSNPVIWSHYADNHRGIALEFEVKSEVLINVKYIEERLDPKKFRESSDAKERVRLLAENKFRHWEYEYEGRLLVDPKSILLRDDIELVRFDNYMKLTGVILGCQYKCSNCGILDAELKKKGIEITTSRCAFTKFEIVEQKDNRLHKYI